MATYILSEYNGTAAQTLPTSSAPPAKFAQPAGPLNPNMPPQSQAFEVVVTGVGSVSATVQLIASNDDAVLTNSSGQWFKYMDPITVAPTQADVTPGTGVLTGSQPWKYFSAYVSAISGTSTKATVKMSC